MSLEPARLLAELDACVSQGAPPGRYVLALSGGLDSTVLLHALAATRTEHGIPLHAVHIDHGLHAASAEWADAACRFAAAMDVPCRVVRVTVGTGAGPEAAARDARYAALTEAMEPGDWLLSAHHADDQAETLLLNLLRGSGPEGLAAMAPIRPFGPGYLVRPLLRVSRQALAAYASAHDLAWIEDPSNADESLDRNYLRRRVLPRLYARWPRAGRQLVRSAALNHEAATLLRDAAERDLAALAAADGGLPLADLAALGRPRQAQVLRRAVARAGLPPPPATAIREIQSSLLEAREDAHPVVRWPGAECRRFRARLYLLPPVPVPAFDGAGLSPGAPVRLGAGLGRLALEAVDGPGLDARLVDAGLVLRRRRGGEELRPLGHAHTRKLKKLLQDAAVYPWWRDSLPLVYAGERLVAVAPLWLASAAATSPGYALRWDDGPRLA